MTMEQDQEQMQGALYVAVDDGNKIIAMERSRRGDEGFRALLDEFTDYAANCGAIPSVLFFDIRTTDAALLPRIEAAEHNYLRTFSIADAAANRVFSLKQSPRSWTSGTL